MRSSPDVEGRFAARHGTRSRVCRWRPSSLRRTGPGRGRESACLEFRANRPKTPRAGYHGRVTRRLAWFGLTALTLALSALAAPPAPVSFREEVEPILKADCTGCHGKDAQSGKLRLDSPEALFAGGEKFGKKTVVRGNPKASALVGYLRGTHKPQMPIGMPPLKDAQIQAVERWIAQGAKIDAPKLGFPYVKPKTPNVPTPKNPVLGRRMGDQSPRPVRAVRFGEQGADAESAREQDRSSAPGLRRPDRDAADARRGRRVSLRQIARRLRKARG